jgi:hypothetical protein
MSETTPSRDTITQHPGASEDTQALRERALKRLEDRRGLMAHALAYLSVNVLLVAIWVATGAGFFWPLFPIFGWGIGLAFHAWSVFWPEPEAQVDREIERIRRHRREEP